MSLRDQVNESKSPVSVREIARPPIGATAAHALLKARVHKKLLDQLDLGAMESMPADKLRA